MTTSTTGLRNERLLAALEAAIASGASGASMAELFDQMQRVSGLPEGRWAATSSHKAHALPRPNLELARALGAAIARHGRKGDAVVKALLAAQTEYPKIVAAAALAARRLAGVDPKGAMQDLEGLVEDGRHLIRIGVVDALRTLITEVGPETVADLAAWTDGYLQAHVALEALADKALLTGIQAGSEVLARLDEAFTLADLSPRAAERSQGLRLLRQELPAQITVFAARYPETLDWLLERTGSKRPETREVVAATIARLRKGSLSDADAARLDASLAKTGPPPRDPSRIVQGTRKRSKGRR
jgi:hypothetical protein